MHGRADESSDRLTGAEVQQGFLQVTGDELVVTRGTIGLVGWGPPAEHVVAPRAAHYARKYGYFTIVVYRGRVPAPKQAELVDEDGVRWYREQNEPGISSSRRRRTAATSS